MKTNADKLGIIVSIGCIIHCVLTPILLPILPAVGFVFVHDALIHTILMIVIIAIALLAFIPGYKKHENRFPFILASLGVGTIFCMGMLEWFNTLAGEHFHRFPVTFVTILGSIIIVIAHYFNHKYICACKHHGDHKCH